MTRIILLVLALAASAAEAQTFSPGGIPLGGSITGNAFSGGALSSSLQLASPGTACSDVLAMAIAGDTDTGLQHPSANQLSLCVAGVLGAKLSLETSPGILGTRNFMRLGNPANGAVYAGADADSAVDLGGAGVNLWITSTSGNMPLSSIVFQLEAPNESRLMEVDTDGAGAATFYDGMPTYFQSGVIGQAAPGSTTPTATLSVRGLPVYVQTPTVTNGDIFGVFNGIGGSPAQVLDASVATGGHYSLALLGGATLQSDFSGSSVLKAGSFNGAIRLGGSGEIGITASAAVSDLVMDVASSMTASSKTLISSTLGKGLQVDWQPQTASCASNAVSVDVQSPYVEISPNAAACTVTITNTTAHVWAVPIRHVTVMVDHTPGGGTVKFAGLTHVSTLCGTTGIADGESITIAYDPVHDAWTETACD